MDKEHVDAIVEKCNEIIELAKAGKVKALVGICYTEEFTTRFYVLSEANLTAMARTYLLLDATCKEMKEDMMNNMDISNNSKDCVH